MKETKGFQVVMGYRYIDDIIEEQKNRNMNWSRLWKVRRSIVKL